MSVKKKTYFYYVIHFFLVWGEFSFPLFKQPVKSQSNGEFIKGNILLYSLSKKKKKWYKNSLMHFTAL